MISEKSIMAYMFLDHGDAPRCSYKKNFLLEFPIPWTYIYLQKEGIAKHFGKKKYAIGSNSCYLFNVEHGIENEMDSAYGVFMH